MENNVSIFFKKIYTIENFQKSKLNSNGFELDLSYFDFYLADKKPNFYNQKILELFGKPRLKNQKILNGTMKLQELFKDLWKNCFHLIKITKGVGGKSNNIVIAGGAQWIAF